MSTSATLVRMSWQTAALDPLSSVLADIARLPPEERVAAASEFNEAMLEGQRQASRLRRSAIRELRGSMTLREIGDLLGMSAQRVAQIEAGMGRHEKAAGGRVNG